ncbi:MAG TPA: HAMP domain-containing sensor histidine kinase [Kofleriaceae bacterium]|nr:HAMP domain-containing sensor histidine kinase [Kofleriaceae bacterium]
MMEANLETASDAVVQREILSTASLLTGGLAHEINNALTSLLTNLSSLAELLPADPSSPARGELAAAQDAAEHIVTVVRDVQALLRSERRAALIDPRVAIERALRLARRRAEGIASLRADLVEVPLVRGSDAWLTQIALNLVLNAIAACQAGAPRSGQVVVTLRRDGDAVSLAVADDGVGMDVKQAEQVFRTIVAIRPGSGTGLGLAVTCRLINAMGGVIEFDSEPGRGTSFRVRLPAASDLP